MRIDLNCDLGEGVGDDAALLRLVTSANVACGGHAGDAASMLTVCRLAAEGGVTVGAHPSYPDREGFGRRDLDLDRGHLVATIIEQCDALDAAAAAAGIRVRYLKPHGALYNRIVHDRRHAEAVAEVASERGLPLLGLAGSQLHRAAESRGVTFFREAFADRGYRADGTLVPRGERGALLTDPSEIAARVHRMVADGTVVAADGTRIRVDVDSVCVHGDTPHAAAIARAVGTRLAVEGIETGPFG